MATDKAKPEKKTLKRDRKRMSAHWNVWVHGFYIKNLFFLQLLCMAWQWNKKKDIMLQWMFEAVCWSSPLYSFCLTRLSEWNSCMWVFCCAFCSIHILSVGCRLLVECKFYQCTSRLSFSLSLSTFFCFHTVFIMAFSYSTLPPMRWWCSPVLSSNFLEKCV